MGNKSEYENIGKICYNAFAFLILFMAFVVQNIASDAFNKDGFGALGNYSLATRYVANICGSLMGSAVFAKIGFKMMQFIGSLGYVAWLLAGMLPAYIASYDKDQSESIFFSTGFVYALVLFASILNGFGSALLWMGQGKYFADCSPESKKGLYYSLFWFIFQSNMIFGNLMSAFLLLNGNQFIYFVCMSGLAVIASLMFLALKKPRLFEKKLLKNGELEVIEEEEREQIEQEHDQATFKENTLVIFRLMADRRMVRLYPEILWTGVTLSINSSMLINLMGDCVASDGGDTHRQFFLPVMAMCAFGIGEMAGSLTQGRLVDKYGTQKTIFSLMLIILTCCILTVIFNELHTFSPLAYFMCFFWGCNDGAISSHIATLLGFEFPQNDTPFGVLNIVQAIASTIVQFVLIPVNTKVAWRWFTVAACTMGILGCGYTWFFDFKTKYQVKSKQREFESLQDDLINPSIKS